MPDCEQPPWPADGACGSEAGAATVAFFLMLFYILRGTVASWGQPWEWMKTPVALAASVTVIIGVAPFLQFKRHPQEKDR